MLKRILFIVCLFLVLGYTLFAAFYFSKLPNNIVCKELSVSVVGSEKNPLLTKENILSSLKNTKYNPLGKQISSINTEEIECFIEQNQLVKKVVVFYSATGRLSISVLQREPLFRVMGESGNFFVDRDGSIMPIQHNFVAKLPIVSGYVEKSFASNELRNFVLYLQDNEFWNQQIEQIYVLPNHEVELIPKVGKHRIVMGTLSDVDKKLSRLMKFYQEGLSEIGWNRYSILNLKYDKQIVCTKK